MGNEIVETPSNGKKPKSSTQVLDVALSKWLERQFRGGESPQSIDAYPMYRGRDREQRLYHYDIKTDEKVDAERAVELANEIYSDCQLHCDNLPRPALNKDGSKTYEVAIIDDRRGGLAKPVGTHLLRLEQRIHRPAPEDDNEDDIHADDGDALTARKMILEVHRENTGAAERAQAGVLNVVGETMGLLKESLKDAFIQNRELHNDIRGMMGEFREMIKAEGQRRVEEKAVAIDAENAAVEREFRRAQMMKENMWTNVMQAGMLEGVKVLGMLFPGFGHLFSALIQGKPVPSPPQLPGTNGANGTAAPNGQPQLPPPTMNEKAYVDRFIETAEKEKFDETSTRAEKLFGKDDAQGKQIEAGVFTRQQVAILTGVHVGSLGIEALDALLPNSGKPEEIKGVQMAAAMAFLTQSMIEDISKVLEMRNAAKKS